MAGPRGRCAENGASELRTRKKLITKYLWNDEPGLFSISISKPKGSTYQYASMFYPLWAGLATPEQAKGVEAN